MCDSCVQFQTNCHCHFIWLGFFFSIFRSPFCKKWPRVCLSLSYSFHLMFVNLFHLILMIVSYVFIDVNFFFFFLVMLLTCTFSNDKNRKFVRIFVLFCTFFFQNLNSMESVMLFVDHWFVRGKPNEFFE